MDHKDKTQRCCRSKGRPRCFDRAKALDRALAVFWRLGYAPTSVAELCRTMEINPPSLYATFGNKAELFLEALHHYELTYWTEPAKLFANEADVYKAVEDFFATSAHILMSPETPCGCMVVLAAVNICESETEIIRTVHALRQETRQMFANRLARAVEEGQLPASTDVETLAGALNAFLEGLSLQAREGTSQEELAAIAALAVSMLPAKQRTANMQQLPAKPVVCQD